MSRNDFVNRRSRVQVSKAAPVKTGPTQSLAEVRGLRKGFASNGGASAARRGRMGASLAALRGAADHLVARGVDRVLGALASAVSPAEPWTLGGRP